VEEAVSLLQYRMRGLEVTERRTITPDERRDLHAKGRKLMRRVWMTAAIVCTVIAVSSELYAHGFLDVPEALAMVIVAVLGGALELGTNWPLGRRLLRVTGQDEVLDCQPGGPLVGMDRHQRVVAPTGVVIQRDREDLKMPEAIWVRAVSSLPADVLADIERQIAEGALEGTRVLASEEQMELRAWAGRSFPLIQILTPVYALIALVENRFELSQGLAKATLVLITGLSVFMFVRWRFARGLARGARFRANVKINGRVVRWVEYVNGKLWTVEGAPAPWRTDFDAESRFNIR
jgi:hypothetical protein